MKNSERNSKNNGMTKMRSTINGLNPKQTKTDWFKIIINE